jgi:aryl-alcohol dehydrogenase-like predicted oxidoreductase
MQQVTLKHTDLKVSRLCFGTMTFGKPVDQQTATAMVTRSIDAGINFFDTANIYQTGVSEEMTGNALAGRRDKVILASKVRGKMSDAPGDSGLSKRAMRKGIEDSLRRLKTDYLDLYYLHQPDYDSPIEETLETMDALLREGKVRYPATSNYSGWQVVEYLPMAKRYGVSIIAYNPLAGGMLTGKHRPQVVPPGTRFDKNKMYQDRYWHEENFRAVERLKEVAEKAGRSLISLSFGWLLHHTVTDCVLLGASRPEQLEQNLLACREGPLPPEALEVCDQVWHELRDPVPVYNR